MDGLGWAAETGGGPDDGADDGAGEPRWPWSLEKGTIHLAEPRFGTPPASPQPTPAGLPTLLAYRPESSQLTVQHELQAEDDAEPTCEYCGDLLRPFPFSEDITVSEEQADRFCCERSRELYEFITKERKRLEDASSLPGAVSIQEPLGSETSLLLSQEQENRRLHKEVVKHVLSETLIPVLTDKLSRDRQQKRQLARELVDQSLKPSATEGSQQAGSISYELSLELTSPKSRIPETVVIAAEPELELEPEPEREPQHKEEPEPEPPSEEKPKLEPWPKEEPEPEPQSEEKPKLEPWPKEEPEPEPQSEEKPKLEPRRPKEEPRLEKEPWPKEEPELEPWPKEEPSLEKEPWPKEEPSLEKEPWPKEEPSLEKEPWPKEAPSPDKEPRHEEEPEPEPQSEKEPGPEPKAQPEEKPEPKKEPKHKEPVSRGVLHYDFSLLGKKVGKAKLVQKYYKNGQKFLTMLPDGTSQLFYPSGNLAINIIRGRDQLTCIVQEDELRTTKIRALFQSDGSSTCYYPNGDEWINMSIQGGQYLDQAGNRIRRWIWPELSPGPQAPLSPIFISLNCHVGVRILAQDKIFVSFLAKGRQAKFNMGTKVQVGAGSQLPPPARLGEDELLLLAFRVRILQLFDRMRGCLNFPSSEQWNKMQPPMYLMTQAVKILELCMAADISDELRSSIKAIVNAQ